MIMTMLAFEMTPLTTSLIAFIGVAGLLGAVVLLLDSGRNNTIESRLDVLAGKKTSGKPLETHHVTREALSTEGLKGLSSITEIVMRRFGSLKLLFLQADTKLKPEQFIMLMAGMAGGSLLAGMAAQAPIPTYPICFLFGGFLPVVWLMFVRGQRFKKFGKQLPDAMALIARALRSGHSLASAMKVVVDELPEPISKEFNIAYEEQNLGIPIETSLKNIYTRVPNLDYKFFAMAVAIQRQSGGDLSEILDKIGHIIRERFRIMGQVQALTGEGRISGIVLMALPIALFFAVWYLNAEYVMLLFTDPLGQQMVAVAIFLQVLGAVTIKKIITIKV